MPPGTFPADPATNRRRVDRPAGVMLLAPVLGLGIWAAILTLLF